MRETIVLKLAALLGVKVFTARQLGYGYAVPHIDGKPITECP